ncbi:MAG: MCP four helix bundle domain-containing protein [Proteobacteria bacterium]|uniref:methyl-accepting chemotaxis protein n=1 Tax=Aquabacterium sp. TaxID=1872578 RepID=UPI0035C6D337|nr:MCP four helix bundle domain-containing protein [Pseudomonadota bacterium]
MLLSKLPVGARLGLGFLLLIAAGLCVAIFGRYRLVSVNDQVATLVEQHMVRVEELYEVKENLNLVARAVRNIALMDDKVAMQAEQERIKKARARNSELMKSLDGSLKGDQERALLAQIQRLRGTYGDTIDQSIALGMNGQAAEAREVLIKENRPVQSRYFEVLEALIDLQKKAMNDTAQEVRDSSASASVLMLGIAGVAAVVGGLMAWSLTHSITHQLGGEPDYASNVAREIAAGNLAVEVKVAPGDKDSLLAAMRVMRDSLADVVTRVRQGSESVATASAQIATGNHDLSGRTEEQASALEETAASMEQLGSTVAHNADNARQANQLAQSASSVAEQGGDVVAQVVSTMRDINTSSQKIADIIGVIDGIAFQTNILALNAAVEAARAGEQGRGFAVVASEVRSLAGRSAEAAKEIKTLITDSVERVEQGSMLVDKAGSTMHEVVTSIRRVTDIMSEITAASIEQSTGVSQVGEAVTQMDQTTQQNAALVEEMAAAASSLQHQAQDLVQSVNVFKLS